MTTFIARIPVFRYVTLMAAFLYLSPLIAIAQDGNHQGPGKAWGSAVMDNQVTDYSVSDLLNTAALLVEQNYYEQGMQALTRAYQLAQANGNASEIRDVLATMAHISYKTNDLEQAQRYYQQLLASQEGSLMEQGVTLFNLGHVSASLNNYTKAEREFTEALDISRELEDISGQAFALKALGVNAQVQGKPELAEIYLLQAMQLFQDLGEEVQVAHANRHLGDLSLELQEHQRALVHYLQALPVYLDGNVTSGLMRTYQGLSTAYEALGEYDSALVTYKAFNTILNEQLTEQGKETTRQLQVALETQRYADENSQLAVENQLQQAEISYQQSIVQKQSVINILGLCMLVLIGMMFFRSQQFAQKMKALATTDELTGLFNRRAILAHGESELQRAIRFDRPFSCLMLDIDHFKRINDSYGHDIGDLVLKKVSGIVQTTLRNTDFFGRVGGEEFLLLAPETDTNKAETLAERIRLNVQAVQFDEMHGRQVTVSVGVARLTSGNTLDLLIKQADKALYTAKNDGRNQVVVSGA